MVKIKKGDKVTPSIPNQIISEIDLLVKNDVLCEEWMDIKKYLLRSISSELRVNFSTRDHKTKAQSLNNFERRLIAFYESHTGIRLKVGNEE